MRNTFSIEGGDADEKTKEKMKVQTQKIAQITEMTKNELDARLSYRSDLLQAARTTMRNMPDFGKKYDRVFSAYRRFESTAHDTQWFIEAGFGLLAAIASSSAK